MMLSSDSIGSWLQSRTPCDFKAKFQPFLDRKVFESVKDSQDSISFFIRGLNAEFIDQNYSLAFSYYEDGANQLDCFCLYRLFDIYLGRPEFKTEYNEEKCLTYLAYGAILEGCDYKLDIWTLFQTFKTTKDPQLKKILKILDIPIPAFGHFPQCAQLMSVFLKFQFTSVGFEKLLSILKNLSVEEKRAMGPAIVSHLMDLMTTKLHAVNNDDSVRSFVDVLVRFHTEHAAFDSLYRHYYTMLKLVGVNKDLSKFFSHKLENMFWVWVFSFLNITKNIYLSELTPLIDNFMNGNITLKWSNTMSWIRSYKGYHMEKGLGCKRDLDKAVEQNTEEIENNPQSLYARVRRIIILKKQERKKEEEEYKEEFMRVFESRLGQPGRIDCYLFYVMGKYQEKVLDDDVKAVEWYQKGIDALNVCHKVQWFGNESWRLYCEKRRDKILRRKGDTSGTQKWAED